MDIYNIWCDLKTGVPDLEFVAAVRAYLDRLHAEGKLAGYRITRRKLGLGPADIPEWHLSLDFTGLAQLDAAFGAASERADPIEALHHAVNGKVDRVRFALYRDFPDAHRRAGEERF